MPINTFMTYTLNGHIISIEDYIMQTIFYIEHLNDRIEKNKYLDSSIKELNKAIELEKKRYKEFIEKEEKN